MADDADAFAIGPVAQVAGDGELSFDSGDVGQGQGFTSGADIRGIAQIQGEILVSHPFEFVTHQVV